MPFRTVVVVMSLALVPCAIAQESQPPGRHRPPGPPPEAFDACRGAAEGTACSFTGPHGVVEGVCFTPPRLACVPTRRPEGGPGGGHVLREKPGPGPVQAAVAACSKAEADAACSFEGPEGPVNGTCRAPLAKEMRCATIHPASAASH